MASPWLSQGLQGTPKPSQEEELMGMAGAQPGQEMPAPDAQDISASTPQTNAMAAQLNPAPSARWSPSMVQPSSPNPGAGSVFNFSPQNRLPEDINKQAQIRHLLKQAGTMDNASFDAQKKDLQTFRDQIKQTLGNNSKDIDLSGLAALTDAWSGSHLSQNYKAPISQHERQMIATKLNEELLKRQQDLTKDQRDAIKDRLNAELGIAKLSADTSVSNQIRTQEANAKHLENAQKSLNLDKNYVKATGTLDETNTVAHQLDNALVNPVAAAATPIALARMMTGGQRLNEVEINALGGAPGILNKLQQIAQTMQNGTLTPQNHKFMLDLANTLQKSAEENKIETEKKHAHQYSKLTGQDFGSSYMNLTGGTPEDVEKIEARDWVKKNPKDPRVKSIRAHYGF